MKILWIFAFCVFFLTTKIFADSGVTWRIDEGSKIEIRAKYTFGTHELSTKQISGDILELKGKYSGEIKVPIMSIKEGSAELECHLQEALGLNYEKSDFPDKHICTKDDKIPSEGPNSISYPDIRFEVENLEKGKDRFIVSGQWTIHGVTKKEKMDIMFQEIDSDLIKLKGKIKFNLKDYGVIVKKAFVISVNDEVEAILDLNLRKGR
jgi:polyisoprenoid-binding protein YceI